MKKLLAILIFILGCDPKQPNIELIQDMMDQPSYKAQDQDPITGLSSNRLPPEGTVPRGFKPYAFKPSEGELAGKKLLNPSRPDAPTLAKGQERYKTFCAVCHGESGKGDGPVAEKFTVKRPPSLLSDLVRGYPDGRIFHIITVGQGIMGSYAGQVGTPENRWALVTYIRSLQKLTKETK
jgi:mono/diheme cytochrome c family protein